ncbi:hypothetical protein KEM54_002193 [Ascosphaera aggregata]|nr:hypothetical protein KEM54_002193 [Ascosphaera aggregata]
MLPTSTYGSRPDCSMPDGSLPHWRFYNGFSSRYNVCLRGGLYHWIGDNRLPNRSSLDLRHLTFGPRQVGSVHHDEPERLNAGSSNRSRGPGVNRTSTVADVDEVIERLYLECTSFFRRDQSVLVRDRIIGGLGYTRLTVRQREISNAIMNPRHLGRLEAYAPDEQERRRLVILRHLVNFRRAKVREERQTVRGRRQRASRFMRALNPSPSSEPELACCRGSRCRFRHPDQAPSFLLNIQRDPRTLREDRSPERTPGPPQPPGPIYAFPVVIRPDAEHGPDSHLTPGAGPRVEGIVEFQFEDPDGPAAQWIASAAPGLGSERTCSSATFPELTELEVTCYCPPTPEMPRIRSTRTLSLQVYLDQTDLGSALREAVLDRYNILRSRMRTSRGMRWIRADEARWALDRHITRPRCSEELDWLSSRTPSPLLSPLPASLRHGGRSIFSESLGDLNNSIGFVREGAPSPSPSIRRIDGDDNLQERVRDSLVRQHSESDQGERNEERQEEQQEERPDERPQEHPPQALLSSRTMPLRPNPEQSPREQVPSSQTMPFRPYPEQSSRGQAQEQTQEQAPQQATEQEQERESQRSGLTLEQPLPIRSRRPPDRQCEHPNSEGHTDGGCGHMGSMN